MSSKISALTLAGTLDGTEQAPLLQVGSPVSAGSFVVGTAYFILSIGTTDFTAIGATANTVGLIFTATGVGTGTGTAGPALDRRASVQNIAALSRGFGLYSQIRSATPTAASTGLSTWLNQGGASVADNAVGITLTVPSNGSAQNVRGRYKAAPTPPYTITALCALTPLSLAQFTAVAIGWYDGTNKIQTIEINQRTTTPSPLIFVLNYATPTSAPSTNFSGSNTEGFRSWLQIADDGTNVFFRWSADGVNFKTQYNIAKASGALGSGGYSNILFMVNAFNTDTFGTMMSYTQV